MFSKIPTFRLRGKVGNEVDSAEIALLLKFAILDSKVPTMASKYPKGLRKDEYQFVARHTAWLRCGVADSLASKRKETCSGLGSMLSFSRNFVTCNK